MRALLRLTPGIALAAVAWGGVARADGNDDDLAGLLSESVVAAASKTVELGRDAPATSSVITGDAIRKYGARTLNEAIDMLALGVMSARSGNTDDLGARGVLVANDAADHFLVLIDGVRANSLVQGAARLGRGSGVPIEIVDHIEVVLGPGSVLFGSNAMLGVINVVTKDAKDFHGAKVGVESDLFTSIRPWAGYGATFEVLGVKGAVTTEVQYYKQWGPHLYFAPVPGGIDSATGQPYRYTTAPVGTGVWGGAESADLGQWEQAAAVATVRLGKFELSLDGDLGREPSSSPIAAFDSGARSDTRRLLGNLAYAEQYTPVLSLKTNAYVNAADERSTLVSTWQPYCPSSDGCTISYPREGVFAGVNAAPSFDWLQNGTLVTMIGGEGEYRSVRGVLNTFDRLTGAPLTPSTGRFDQRTGVAAAYAQQIWDPLPALGFNAGARIDYDPRFDPQVSPRFAARVEPWRGGTLKAIYSEAFRAPSYFESDFSSVATPAPENLQPEHERSFEASVEERFAAQRILFGGFVTRWTDLISRYYFSAQEASAYVAAGKAIFPPTFQTRNLFSIRNVGFNAAFEGSQLMGKLQYGLNLTVATATVDDGGVDTPLPAAPRAFGNAHVSIALPGALPTLAVAAVTESARPYVNAFTSGFHPYPYAPARLTLRATATGGIPGIAGLSYRVSGFYNTSDREPYAVGPEVAPSAQYASPAMLPIERAQVTVGLQYEFAP